MAIQQVMAWVAVCDCGCGETLPLGCRIEMADTMLAMNGWKSEGAIVVSPRCKLKKKTAKKGRR